MIRQKNDHRLPNYHKKTIQKLPINVESGQADVLGLGAGKLQKEEVLSDQKLSCFNPGILSCATDYPKVLWGKGSLIQFSDA